MIDWLLNLRIEQFSFLLTVGALSIAGALYLLIRKPTKQWALTAGLALAIGGAFGYFAAWFVGDVLNLFGVALTPSQQGWVVLTFAGIALAIVNLWKSRWWRKVVAIVSIPSSLFRAPPSSTPTSAITATSATLLGSTRTTTARSATRPATPVRRTCRCRRTGSRRLRCPPPAKSSR